MTQNSKLAQAYELLRSAESAIASAKDILAQYEDVGDGISAPLYIDAATIAAPRVEGNVRIIEGVFDGQNMQAPDQRLYPIPANYASKSKLIPGDRLKLTITERGEFKYKQIGPIPRRQLVGIVTYNDGEYYILAENKVYKVLLASITYYKAEVGSQVTIIVPEQGESEWCAIEHLLPS